MKLCVTLACHESIIAKNPRRRREWFHRSAPELSHSACSSFSFTRLLGVQSCGSTRYPGHQRQVDPPHLLSAPTAVAHHRVQFLWKTVSDKQRAHPCLGFESVVDWHPLYIQVSPLTRSVAFSVRSIGKRVMRFDRTHLPTSSQKWTASSIPSEY